MKKLFILVGSLLVTLSMAIFYSNFRLFAMDSNVSTQQELIDAIGNNNNVVLSNDITISSAINIPSLYTGTIKSDGSTKTLKLSSNFSEENMLMEKRWCLTMTTIGKVRSLNLKRVKMVKTLFIQLKKNL